MPEPVVFTVRYSKAHCLATALRFWQRRLGYKYLLELAIGGGLVVLALQGTYGWLQVGLAIAVGLFALFGIAIFLLHWQRALLGMRMLDPPESTWTLTEETIAQKSSLGESAIPWEALLGVWRFEDLWLLVWGKDVYSTIPVAQFPREARDLVERRTRETGGVVR